jgi:hypothetical protein
VHLLDLGHLLDQLILVHLWRLLRLEYLVNLLGLLHLELLWRLLLQLSLFHLLGLLVLESVQHLRMPQMTQTRHTSFQELSNHHQEVLSVELPAMQQGLHTNQESLPKFQRILLLLLLLLGQLP